MSNKLTIATHLREEGDYKAARSIILELLDSEPDHPYANYECAWVHDLLGYEQEAVSFYQKAIEKGLAGRDLEAAIIGIGSSHRYLGEYGKAIETLQVGAIKFPMNRAIQVFLAMSLYNIGEYCEATSILLQHLVQTSSDDWIGKYKRAILHYGSRLDETKNR